MGRILAQSPQSSGGMSGPGRRSSANPAGNGGGLGGRRGAKEKGGGLPPNIPKPVRGAFFARFAGSGSAPVSARPASRSRRGREFPECPGKGAARPAPHGATGKAFFRLPVRIRRVRAECGALAAPAVGGGFGAGNDIAAVRQSGRVIFSAISYYRKTSGREFPECPGKGAERPAPHGGAGKAFFVAIRSAIVPLLRSVRSRPVSTSYYTPRRAP